MHAHVHICAHTCGLDLVCDLTHTWKIGGEIWGQTTCRHCGCVSFVCEQNISRCTKRIQDDMFDVSSKDALASFKLCCAYVSILMLMEGWQAMFVLSAKSFGKQILPLRLMCNSFSTATSLSSFFSVFHFAFEAGMFDIDSQIIGDSCKLLLFSIKSTLHNINPTCGRTSI